MGHAAGRLRPPPAHVRLRLAVCVLAGGWARWAATVDELLHGLSEQEKQALLCGTATGFYHLSQA
ncbi:hypothetical protein ACIQU3_22585 [Streptomyces sp. NPDC101110]|uniref:hypothetical protein n=1 Tax=Streptomyces sp. NPDC101110 TaxID=3366104 RepID=UPI0037F3E776